MTTHPALDLAEQVREALIELEIDGRVTPLVGPRRVTFNVRPDKAEHTGVLLRRADRFRWWMRTNDVDVSPDDEGGVLVSAPNPRPGYIPVKRLGGRGWQIPIGLDRQNRPVGVDLLVHPMNLIVGPPRTGKTNLGRVIAHNIARQLDPADARLVIVTGDPADWRGVERLPHTAAVLLHRDAPPVIRALRDEVQRREASGERTPPIVLFVDDSGVLFEHDPDLGKVMLALVKQGRRVGVQCVFIAHTAGKTDLGHYDIGQIIVRRFQTQAGTSWAAAAGAGQGGTNATALGIGEVVSVGDTDRARPYVVTVARCKPSDLQALAVTLGARYADFEADPLPWLEGGKDGRTEDTPPPPPSLSVVRPPVEGGKDGRAEEPRIQPLPGVLDGLTERERDVVRRLRQQPDIGQIVREVYGVSGGREYQTRRGDVLALVARMANSLALEDDNDE